MAFTEYYVDPAINANSGTGTIGDPFGDLQHALDTVTRDATNGDRFNIKSGTAEVLTASLSTATYGTATAAAPTVLQGYTSTAGDGGMGTISGGGTYGITGIGSASNYIRLIDLELTNSGSAPIVGLGAYNMVLRCKIHNTTGHGIEKGASSIIAGCYIYNVASTFNRYAIYAYDPNMVIVGNRLEPGGRDPTHSILMRGFGQTIAYNIISVAGATNGIASHTAQGPGSSISHNTIYSAGGTGTGISTSGAGAGILVANNIVAGFSGSGGKGIEQGAGTIAYGNACYNNETHYTYVDGGDQGNNDELASDPFVDAANGDLAIDGTVAGVTEDAEFKVWPGWSASAPKADKGAVQAGAGSGGAGGGGPVIGSRVIRGIGAL